MHRGLILMVNAPYAVGKRLNGLRGTVAGFWLISLSLCALGPCWYLHGASQDSHVPLMCSLPTHDLANFSCECDPRNSDDFDCDYVPFLH